METSVYSLGKSMSMFNLDRVDRITAITKHRLAPKIDRTVRNRTRPN